MRRRRRFRGPLQSQGSETDLTPAITAATAGIASSASVPTVSVSSAGAGVGSAGVSGAGVSGAGVSGALVGSVRVVGGEVREVMLRQPVAPGLGVKSRLERRKSSVFSSDSAKRKWRLFERKVNVRFMYIHPSAHFDLYTCISRSTSLYTCIIIS